jgi:hypothetical protein
MLLIHIITNIIIYNTPPQAGELISIIPSLQVSWLTLSVRNASVSSYLEGM